MVARFAMAGVLLPPQQKVKGAPRAPPTKLAHAYIDCTHKHPNTIVHVENAVSLFSSPSTSSQKV